jgi:hypothetical protein
MNDLNELDATVKGQLLAIERSVDQINRTREDLVQELKLLLLKVAREKLTEDSE